MSLVQGTRSVDEIEDSNQQQAADRTQGSQQGDQRARRERQIGHEDFLKGRNESVLVRRVHLAL